MCTIVNERKVKQVVPIAECVQPLDPANNRYLASFGWDNNNPYPVDIEYGPQNRFVPDLPDDKKQPTDFAAGRHRRVLEAEFTGAEITWRLDGDSATVTRNTKLCEPLPTLIVKKVVVGSDKPASDFSFTVNALTTSFEADGENTVSLPPGSYNVTEPPVGGFTTTTDGCTGVVLTTPQDTVPVCTITNTAPTTPPTPPTDPTPPTPPTPPRPTPPTPIPPTPPRPTVDIAVTKTASPTTVSVDGRITWVIRVRNLSSTPAEDVAAFKLETVLDPRLELISVRTTRGTCDPTGCRLGTLPARGSATITVVTRAIATGVAVNTVRVSTTSPETRLSNNTASALARVIGPLRPPPDLVCRYVTVSPTSIVTKRTSVVLARARNRAGQPIRGLVLQAKGPGVSRRARTDASGIARFVLTATRRGNLYINPPGRTTAAAGTRPCAVALGILDARTPPPSLTG